MIVKVLPPKPAGTGRPLGTYILDLKHETAGERLGAYVPDPEKHKLEYARTVHTGVDDPCLAIGAIERHNAQNTRWHRLSRWDHVVVSFALKERPTREQMAVIEDRLMSSIGFGDHPRLSAVHGNTEMLHLHIAVSRIDPTTLKAEHPRHNHFKLQAEAARLEIDLGLRQERKTLLARERREIDDRALLDHAYTGHNVIDGEEMLASDTEQKTTVEFTREELSVLIQQATPSITPGVSESIFDKLAKATNAANISPTKAVAVELTRAELFAVMLDHAVGRDDAKPLRPDIQTNIHEKLLHSEERILAQEHKRSTMTTPRGKEHTEERDRLGRAPGGRATPGDALYARYETEKAIAIGERKAAEQRIYDRWATYQNDLRGFYDLRREQEKLNARQPSRVDRQNAHELLRAEQHGDRVAANQTRAMQLAKVRRDHPLPSWNAFLERESQRGDKEAARILQQNRAREMQHGHER